MEVLREPPNSVSFISLAEHQSQTPASFYTGPAVLHYYSDRSKVIVLEHEVDRAPALAPLLEKATSTQQSNGEGQTNGHLSGAGNQRVVEDVDVWVTSDKLFLFSATASAGLSIPYPSISLHAIQSLPQPSAGEQQGLYMQLVSHSSDAVDDGTGEDSEPDTISVTIIPTASGPPAALTATDDDPVLHEDEKEQTPVMAMFTALSNCSNLHPDPVDPDDEEGGGEGGSRLFQAGLAMPGDPTGGLPPAMPGSGGWITAENMHEFVDEDGNFTGGDDEETEESREALGPGAGNTRGREEDDAEEDETKWRRTS